MAFLTFENDIRSEGPERLDYRKHLFRQWHAVLLVSLHSIRWDNPKLFIEVELFPAGVQNLACPVIPPFLMGFSRRIHAAVFSFMAGVMPPMPMLGRSLL